MMFGKKFDDLQLEHPDVFQKAYKELDQIETEPMLTSPREKMNTEELEKYLKGYHRVQTKLLENNFGALDSP